MTYADDPDDCKRRLEAKLKPNVICSTLAFAGLYQITHEIIKYSVLDQIKHFYVTDLSTQRQRDYEREVLGLAPGKGKAFKASLMWLVQADALTQDQADRLDAIYDHRHALAHELMAYVADPDKNPDIDLFIEALEILKSLDRFWAQIEIDIGSFEHLGDDLTPDDVLTGSTAMLHTCISAYMGQFVNVSSDTEKTKTP